MATILRSVFTQAGMDLAQDALAGNAKITFTRGASSIADWSARTSEDLRDVTKLDDETQVTSIGGIATRKQEDGSDSPSTIDVSLIFNQGDIKADYEMRTVGLFAARVVDGVQGDEILYAITTFSQPQWMSQDNNGSTFTLKVATVIGDTEKLTVILASSQGEGGLSQGELDLFHAQLDKEYDGKYVQKSALPDDNGNVTGDNPIVTLTYLVDYLSKHVVGTPGADGASAYEVWVKAGNSGSVQDFLKSLIGPKGDSGLSIKGDPGQTAYQLWLSKGHTGSEDDFLNSMVGHDGKSAYDVWVAAGNTGTQADFLASLKGAKGDPGTPGATGPGATVTIGTVTKGTTAAVTNVGTAQAAKLNITLPQGDPGKDAPTDVVHTAQLGGATQMAFMTKAAYDALATKDPNTVYFTSES